jgi:hypothetical protein
MNTPSESPCFKIHAGKLKFNEGVRRAHAAYHKGFWKYLLHSRFLVVASSPVIWICAVPILLTDVAGSLYQAICFPIYGIPKVRRADYLAFDRHKLSYLNWSEKLNCEYCAYVNGILGYFTEIAARTEQHWCPIRHAACAKCLHSRYGKFVEFGDARGYREHVEEIRRDYADIKSSGLASTGTGSKTGT